MQSSIEPSPDYIAANNANHGIDNSDNQIVLYRERVKAEHWQYQDVGKKVDPEANEDIDTDFD